MGLLKKFKRGIKKITKPVSRFLDKVVPNEIKPFLPYAAAAVPFFLPASGVFASMAGRAALSGGANLLSQLAQEGSEGDFSGLSTLLAAGTGALAAPGRTVGVDGDTGGTPNHNFLQLKLEVWMRYPKIWCRIFRKNSRSLSPVKGSGGIGDILRPGGTPIGFDKATLGAISAPLAQGTTDLAMATARRALKDYEDELAEYERLTGEAQTASDDARRTAIRAAMIAGGHSEDVISETFSLLGLKDGGVVKMKDGGIMDLGGKEMDLRGGGFVPIGKRESGRRPCKIKQKRICNDSRCCKSSRRWKY